MESAEHENAGYSQKVNQVMQNSGTIKYLFMTFSLYSLSQNRLCILLLDAGVPAGI